MVSHTIESCHNPLLLFKRSVPNCYIAILNHTPAKVITDTCKFRYYQNIVVPTSLVSTADPLYQLNANTEIVVVCGQSKGKTIRQVHSISIIARIDLCLYIINTNYIIILGTYSNCTTDGQFKIYYTFNFATEWIKSGNDIALYEDNMELLNSPSHSFLPKILILDLPNRDTYKERKIPAISLHKLNKLVKYISKDNLLFLQPYDKNRELNKLLKISIESEEDSEQVDNMSTWFGGGIKYSFIFMFSGSIISVLVFECLIILCYKHGKLQQIMTYFVTTIPVEVLNNSNANCQGQNMYLHIFYALLLLVALYYLIILLKKLYNHFTIYNTILNFHRGHGLVTGPRTDIVIEFFH